jgi:hypothetical protein
VRHLQRALIRGQLSWLKNDTVRLRVSCTGDDSNDLSDACNNVASCEHYCHVLVMYSDDELLDMTSVATGRVRCVSSARVEELKEAQVHGPVELRRDVEALVACHRHSGIRTCAPCWTSS